MKTARKGSQGTQVFLVPQKRRVLQRGAIARCPSKAGYSTESMTQLKADCRAQCTRKGLQIGKLLFAAISELREA
jgi:hypothetical protein